MSEHLLATMQGVIKLPSDVVDAAGDELMEALLNAPGAVDPVVSGDAETGEVYVSFEFEAAGNYREDVATALRIFEVAIDERAPLSRAENHTPSGTVQYPLAAAV